MLPLRFLVHLAAVGDLVGNGSNLILLRLATASSGSSSLRVRSRFFGDRFFIGSGFCDRCRRRSVGWGSSSTCVSFFTAGHRENLFHAHALPAGGRFGGRPRSFCWRCR